jgi:16S rRNA (guanine527-N7)-methyltransferase
MDELLKHFPDLNTLQIGQFEQLEALYGEWNTQINVISRKDMEQFYERHLLHSLGISKVIQFKDGSTVLDVGTGGGFPGIPLAILFPNTQFYLIDSIGKKIKVVNAVQQALGLTNVVAHQLRAGDFTKKVDFVKSNLKSKHQHSIKNGILYLKGGDLTEELQQFPKAVCYELKDYFGAAFFETKKVVYLPF